jgi:hypothetical protein
LPAPFLEALFSGGTFAPSFLASDKPIAIACLLEVTFLPLGRFLRSLLFFRASLLLLFPRQLLNTLPSVGIFGYW